MARAGSDKTIAIPDLKPWDKIRVVKGDRLLSGRFVLWAATNKRDSLPAKVLSCQRQPDTTYRPGYPWVVVASAIDPETNATITLEGYFAGYSAILRDRWTE